MSLDSFWTGKCLSRYLAVSLIQPQTRRGKRFVRIGSLTHGLLKISTVRFKHRRKSPSCNNSPIWIANLPKSKASPNKRWRASWKLCTMWWKIWLRNDQPRKQALKCSKNYSCDMQLRGRLTVSRFSVCQTSRKSTCSLWTLCIGTSTCIVSHWLWRTCFIWPRVRWWSHLSPPLLS